MPVNSKQDPIFQCGKEGGPARLEGFASRKHPGAWGNLAVKNVVFGKKFVRGPLCGSLEIVGEHRQILLD